MNCNELKTIASLACHYNCWKLLIDYLEECQQAELITYNQRHHIFDIVSALAINKEFGKKYGTQDKTLKEMNREFIVSDMYIRISA